MYVCLLSRSVVSNSLQPHGLYSPWNSPGQNTGVGSLSFLQGIFPIQGSNPGLLHCRWILYQVSHKGSPRTLEWVAYPSPADLPNPGIEPGSPVLQADSLSAEPPGKPKNIGVEWVAYSFSRGSSVPRNRTRVSCIAGGFFTNWALRELPSLIFGFQPVWSLHVCGQQTVNIPRLVGVSVSRLAVEPDTNWLT